MSQRNRNHWGTSPGAKELTGTICFSCFPSVNTQQPGDMLSALLVLPPLCPAPLNGASISLFTWTVCSSTGTGEAFLNRTQSTQGLLAPPHPSPDCHPVLCSRRPALPNIHLAKTHAGPQAWQCVNSHYSSQHHSKVTEGKITTHPTQMEAPEVGWRQTMCDYRPHPPKKACQGITRGKCPAVWYYYVSGKNENQNSHKVNPHNSKDHRCS